MSEHRSRMLTRLYTVTLNEMRKTAHTQRRTWSKLEWDLGENMALVREQDPGENRAVAREQDPGDNRTQVKTGP